MLTTLLRETIEEFMKCPVAFAPQKSWRFFEKPVLMIVGSKPVAFFAVGWVMLAGNPTFYALGIKMNHDTEASNIIYSWDDHAKEWLWMKIGWFQGDWQLDQQFIQHDDLVHATITAAVALVQAYPDEAEQLWESWLPA